MQANILIIEDEQEIADLITLYLEKEGIRVQHRSTGEEGLALIGSVSFDLVILDINLPGLDGFEVLQQIRKYNDIQVLLLSARKEESDMIMGFGTGADDYVTKPFSPRVLVARIRARLKEKRSGRNASSLLYFGPWTLDCENRWLKRGELRIDLSPKELQILLTLAEHPGRSLSLQDLYTRIWGNNYGDLTTVSVHVQRLRKKIEEDYRNPRYLLTDFGRGYYLKTDQP